MSERYVLLAIGNWGSPIAPGRPKCPFTESGSRHGTGLALDLGTVGGICNASRGCPCAPKSTASELGASLPADGADLAPGVAMSFVIGWNTFHWSNADQKVGGNQCPATM